MVAPSIANRAPGGVGPLAESCPLRLVLKKKPRLGERGLVSIMPARSRQQQIAAALRPEENSVARKSPPKRGKADLKRESMRCDLFIHKRKTSLGTRCSTLPGSLRCGCYARIM